MRLVHVIVVVNHSIQDFDYSYPVFVVIHCGINIHIRVAPVSKVVASIN